MAQIVETAFALEHLVKVSETDGTVILETIPLIPLNGQEVAAFNIFKLVSGCHCHIGDLLFLLLLFQ
jgi:hypothetical protein